MRVQSVLGLAILTLCLGSQGCTAEKPNACASTENMPAPVTRSYFVAAEPVEWSYAPLGRDPAFDRALPDPWGKTVVYSKLRYVRYTDDTFTTKVAPQDSDGILGPMLRASVGDTIHVTFLNRTARPLSMHPHGVKYAPESEGVLYGGEGGARGIAAPGERVSYDWIVDMDAGPRCDGPSSQVWLYHSHVMADEEIYAGLIGTIVVTDPRRANFDASPSDVDREFSTLFMVFDENTADTPEADQEGNLKHAINGRFFANLTGIEMNVGDRVRWYVLSLGNEVDNHTVHWHGETVTTEYGEHTDVLEVLPASMRVVDMHPDNPGTWLLHCHVADHMMAGMYTTYTIK